MVIRRGRRRRGDIIVAMTTETPRPSPSVPEPQGDRSLLGRITNFFHSTAPEPEYKHNDPWNHTINSDAEGMFRVYFQNPHGVPRDMVLLDQDLEALREYDVGCYCFAETNLDWNRPYVRNDFLHQQRKVWNYAATAFSTIDLESTSDYKTGGTLTSAVGAWSSRVAKKEMDPTGMGRWSCLTFVGKKNKRLSVITGYRCVRSTGDGSAWTQEKIYMRAKQEKTSPNPRRQFILDMITFVRNKKKLGHDIILSLDANEVIGEETSGISKLIHDCGLYDLLDIPELDAEAQLQETFRRGNNRRIDYMLGTQRPRDSIRRRGALAYNDGIISDHRGLFIDFDPAFLFGGSILDPVAPASRGFTSKNDKKVKKYLDNLEKYFTDHKVVERVDRLADFIETLPEFSQRLLRQVEFVPGGEKTLRECSHCGGRFQLGEPTLVIHTGVSSASVCLSGGKGKCFGHH